jgi:L-lactate dehydrogenase complex protein LldG
MKEAAHVRAEAVARGPELLDALAESARKNSWIVTRSPTHEDAAEAVARICRDAGIKRALRSAEEVFARVPVDRTLASSGIDVTLFQRESDGDRARLRNAAFTFDAGITGADYAVAETGTIAIHPRRGLSRLISLAPPRHIAIVERGAVLPSLDELFILEREAFLRGDLASSMNLISGPSRTGDIEATIVQGVHGPLETHLVLIG